MTINIKFFILFTISIVVFAFSLIVAPYHIAGDQTHYTSAYEAMVGLSLFESFDVYKQTIYSLEPVHFFISWIFANIYFDKNIAMAILNSIIAFLYGRFLLSRTGNYFILLLLIFSNQYMYAIFFTLEKLKIAILFLLLFVNYGHRLLIVFACLAHFQIALLFSIFYFTSFFERIRFRSFLKHKNLKHVLFLSLIAVGLLPIFKDYIFLKLLYYNSREKVGGWDVLIPIVFVLFATVVSAPEIWKKILLYFITLGFFIYLLGGDRLNMFAYFGFLYFSSFNKFNFHRGLLPLCFLGILIVYFSYKSVEYLSVVIVHGG